MTLGTGIFLAVLMASITALLITFKEKWTWKKLFLYPAIIVTVLTALVSLTLYGFSEGYIGPKKFGDERTFDGVELRSTKSDVLFAKGKPASEEPADADGYTAWQYSTSNSHLVIVFAKDELVSGVSYYVLNYSDTAPDLKWINKWTRLTEVQQKLGEADSVEEINGGTGRIYRYTKYNLRLAYEKGGLVAFGISDYKRYPPKR